MWAELYTVAPLEALFKEERRCPRCGAFLHEDRRAAERRVGNRRKAPTGDSGARGVPDDAGAPGTKGEPPDERRLPDRRSVRRRGGGQRQPPAKPTNEDGWVD